MSDDNIREAANRAVDKLTELRSRQWRDLAEQQAMNREYDAALADLATFRRTFPDG